MNVKDLTIKELENRSWTWILRNFLVPIGDLFFGQRMMKRLRYLESAQWWDREILYSLRDKSLENLVKIAYKEVPIYRKLMNEASLKPEDIQTRNDLNKLPIITKEILRDGYPHLTTRHTGFRTFEHCTSGSTGKNFCVLKDTETDGWYRASQLLSYEWAGWKLGEPYLQTGMTLNRDMIRLLKDIFWRCYYVSAYDLRDNSLDLSLDMMEKNNIHHLWGYPGSLYYLAQRAQKKGWNIQLKSVVTWGDNLYSHYRHMIEAAFGTSVTDTYGCNEGIQVSAQCDHGRYHIHTLDVIIEYLANDGKLVSSDQPGNLILTRLHPGPMPLIRYQVGDVGISGNTQLCECGRKFDIMESIQGRDTDVVITPSGNRLIVHFFTGILEHFKEISAFQVVQEDLDSMIIKVVPAPSFSDSITSRIILALQEKGASDMKISIELVKELPVPESGKRRFVISNLN